MNRSQRIAIWVLTLIGLLAAWKLFGQGFGGFRSDQPFLARNYISSSAWTPQSRSDLWHYWVAEDNPTNVNVTNWVCRITGLVLSNENNTLRPTNSASGVGFDGTTWLTNTVPVQVPAEPTTVFIAFKPYTPANDFAGLVQTSSGSTLGGGYGFFLNTDGGLWYGGDNGNGTVAAYSSGTQMDWITMVSASTNVYYTNGISVKTNDFKNLLWFGTIGAYNTLNRYYKGYIQEIGIITNYLSPSEVTQIHQYLTNKYSYSP